MTYMVIGPECTWGRIDSVSRATRLIRLVYRDAMGEPSKKRGFQAAIPETLRSAARSQDEQAGRIAKKSARVAQNPAAARLDTQVAPMEQKNSFVLKA